MPKRRCLRQPKPAQMRQALLCLVAGLVAFSASACLGRAAVVPEGAEGLPWWNDRVFYEVFVRSFKDSNGDGNGDLLGLIDKLDYLNDGDPATSGDLGITGIWLMPVAESSSYHGYDVVDYRQVERDYGDNDDFRALIDQAHARGIVVIVDLVLNHTSSQHPWFLEALTPGSKHDDWYVWQDSDPGFLSPWGSQVWHPSGSRYYYGLFSPRMPDLNLGNARVRDEMVDVACFWLEEMGADGFRLDGAKHYIEDGAIQEHTEATHQLLERFRRRVRRASPGALVIGEVWSHTADAARYVGEELDLAFEFDLAEAILESVRRSDNRTLVEAQRAVLEAYPNGQYAAFLSNHDQNRALDQVRGDVEAAKIAATLLLTNPGVPFIYYGEEIGMSGSKPDERIRTPMQWDASPTAGFTGGAPWQPFAEGYQSANVERGLGDPTSLLNHYRAVIQLRDGHPALRAGELVLVASETRQAYAYLRAGATQVVLVVVNLSAGAIEGARFSLAEGPLGDAPGATVLLGDGQAAAPEVNARGGFDEYVPLEVLPPYGSFVIELSSAPV